MTDSITANIVHALDTAWAIIQRRHPDVPNVVLTIGSGSLGTKPGRQRLGHFAAGRWQHDDNTLPELFISGEGLRRGAVDVLGTLLHEAAHGVAHTRNIKDTSRQGHYHNQRFRAIGTELGLELAQDPRIGWSLTTVPEHTAASYADTIHVLASALVAYRYAEPSAAAGGSAKSTLVAASCLCSRKIRVARSTLEAAPIICGACGIQFMALS